MNQLLVILRSSLREIGFDGLCNSERDCACYLDFLGFCKRMDIYNCRPAKFVHCSDCPDNSSCQYRKTYAKIEGCLKTI